MPVQSAYCSIEGRSKVRNQGDYAQYTSMRIEVIDCTNGWLFSQEVSVGRKARHSCDRVATLAAHTLHAAEVRRAIWQARQRLRRTRDSRRTAYDVADNSLLCSSPRIPKYHERRRKTDLEVLLHMHMRSV
jgi:hypothetical protein